MSNYSREKTLLLPSHRNELPEFTNREKIQCCIKYTFCWCCLISAYLSMFYYLYIVIIDHYENVIMKENTSLYNNTIII